jgi:hypothetical protein
MEAKILVMYIGIGGIRNEDIDTYMKKVTEKITPTTFEGEIIVLPTQLLVAPDTRMECINPVYITDVELIKQHTIMMKKLQEELQIQLDILKQKNNE